MLICYFAATQTARLVFATLAIFALAAGAEAQYITYVASNGNDANNCFVQAAPCKTLQRAVNQTSANGAVRVLTPLTSSVFINKNITISGDDVPIVGQITIGGATAIVTLRGLALNGVGGYVNGIRIDSAAAVHIEDCTVERYTGDGIRLFASTATELFVSDTVSRDNGYNGLYVGNASVRATIDSSRFENNGDTGVVLLAAESSISRSIASGNGDFGIYHGGGNANVTETIAADNSDGFRLFAGFLTLTSSVARGNSDFGLIAQSTTSAVISDSVFTLNGAGIRNDGTIYSLVNNTNLGNGTDYLGTGVKTTVAPGF
jgi:hypothetical protein